MAPYGWFLLLGAVIGWYLFNKLAKWSKKKKQAKSLEKANDPYRRDILNTDLRRIREMQQEKADRLASEHEREEKKKQDRRLEESAKIQQTSSKQQPKKPSSTPYIGGYNPLNPGAMSQYRPARRTVRRG